MDRFFFSSTLSPCSAPVENMSEIENKKESRKISQQALFSLHFFCAHHTQSGSVYFVCSLCNVQMVPIRCLQIWFTTRHTHTHTQHHMGCWCVSRVMNLPFPIWFHSVVWSECEKNYKKDPVWWADRIYLVRWRLYLVRLHKHSAWAIILSPL